MATEIVRGHVNALRAHPLLRNAHIIFAPERNTGHEGDFLRRALQNFPRMHFCYEKGPENGCGVWTTHALKVSYGFSMRYQFSTRNISLWDQFICANPYQDPATRAGETISKLKEQMGRYRIVYTETDNPHGRNNTTLSGKVNKEGKITKNAKDDICFALSMAICLLDKIDMGMLDWFDHTRLPGHTG